LGLHDNPAAARVCGQPVGAYGVYGVSGVKDARKSVLFADALASARHQGPESTAASDYWTGTGQKLDSHWTKTGQRQAFEAVSEERMSSLHGLTPKAKARRFRALLPDHRGLQDADVLNIEFFGGR